MKTLLFGFIVGSGMGLGLSVAIYAAEGIGRLYNKFMWATKWGKKYDTKPK